MKRQPGFRLLQPALNTLTRPGACARQSLPEYTAGTIYAVCALHLHAMEPAVSSELEPFAPQMPVGSENGAPHVTSASVRTGAETALALWHLLLVTSAGALLLLF